MRQPWAARKRRAIGARCLPSDAVAKRSALLLPTCSLQGYLLGVVLQADRPACAALVHVIGGVMISNEADLLLMQRGLVASSSPAPAQG